MFDLHLSNNSQLSILSETVVNFYIYYCTTLHSILMRLLIHSVLLLVLCL